MLLFTVAGFAENLREKVEPVLVPVTVTDWKGAIVTGLERRRFKLMQDNVPQSIVSFTQQDVPCSVGVIVDTSGSALHRLEVAKAAVRAFLDTVAPRDEASLMSVSSRPKDPVEIRNSLLLARPGGSTALVDTLYLALDKTHSAHHLRRALVVISDAMDSHGRYSKSELMRMAIEADVQIYSISIGVPPRYKKPMMLQDLADKTGGLHYAAESSDAAGRVAKQVGLAIRNQYLIGYWPVDAESSGKWHNIRVSLDVPNTTVYARNGYYAR